MSLELVACRELPAREQLERTLLLLFPSVTSRAL
jgi:hypothetical protein